MPHWGTSRWMFALPTYPDATPGVAGPRFLLVAPDKDARNVGVSTPIRVGVYDPNGDITGFEISVNGVQVYDMAVGATSPAFTVKATEYCGRRVVEVVPVSTEWDYGTAYTVTAYAVDATLNEAHLRTQFSTESLRGSYQGSPVLPIEAAVLRPMTRFLNLEPVRQLLLRQALRDELFTPANRDQVAVRALYQIAYDTELSVVLNPYALRDGSALDVRVREKRATLELEQMLAGYSTRVEAGIEDLINEGALPREYLANFGDYRTSMLYLYRVAAPVVAVFLARAVEEGLTPAVPTVDVHGFGTSFPFVLGG